MGEQTHYIESFYSKLFFRSILSFCILHSLSQLILDMFSCVAPVDLDSFCMLREKPGSELAIKFLHYKVLTSWRCEGVESGGKGRREKLLRENREQSMVDGTELIKALVHYSYLSGKN